MLNNGEEDMAAHIKIRKLVDPISSHSMEWENWKWVKLQILTSSAREPLSPGVS